MTPAIDITAAQRKTLLALLRRFIPGVAVWAYGSRAKWTSRPNSDLDLVAFTTPVQHTALSELKDALAESNLPFLVDIHAWNEIPERFHKIIQKEYVVLQEAKESAQGRGNENESLEIKVEDLAKEGVLIINDGYRAKNIELAKTGIPFARAGNIDGGFHFEDADRVPLETLPRVGVKRSKPGDVVFTSKGTVGRFAFVREDTPEFVYSPQLCFWRSGNLDRIDPRWLYYWMNGPEFFYQYKGVAGQTDMAEYVSLRDQRAMRITVPSLPEQRAIAHILGTLDDKIELNRQMNTTLDAMARALFQSWFVDFDPVRAKLDGRPPVGLDPGTAALFPAHFHDSLDGKLPVGWRPVPIEELCSINSRTLHKTDELDTLEYVEISEVSQGSIANIVTYERGDEPSRARRRLCHGDTVLSTVRPDRGSYFLALNPPENRVASTGFAVLTPTKAPWSFIHAAATRPEIFEHLGQMADGGAYPAIRPEIIGALKVVVPDEPKVLEAFHRTCAPFFEQAEANRTHSRTLAALRDALLPKLLSGELIPSQTKEVLHA